MDDTASITDDAGAVVISITTLRENRLVRPDPKGACSHRQVLVSEIEAWLTCKDCEAKINPTAWVMRIAEEWQHVRRTYLSARAENARLDLRKWVTCRGCGQRVHVYSNSDDEKRRKASREAVLQDALERIQILVPEAAAKFAAEIARKALAAREG